MPCHASAAFILTLLTATAAASGTFEATANAAVATVDREVRSGAIACDNCT